MRAVVQRVTYAEVAVDGRMVAAIGAGQLVLVGIARDDDVAGAQAMARRLLGLRLLPGSSSCSDTGAPLLLVSQFTLYGDTSRGRRPSWSRAASADVARPLFDRLVDDLRRLGASVETGRFGAHMVVTSANDGPMTVIVET